MTLFFGNELKRLDLTDRETIKNVWEDVGFLYGLPKDHKENVAVLYQEAFNKIVDEPTNKYEINNMFQSLVLPAIRRIYNSCLENDDRNIGKELEAQLIALINVDSIIDKILTLTNLFPYESLKKVLPNIDGEVEILVLFEKSEVHGMRKTLREKANG